MRVNGAEASRLPGGGTGARVLPFRDVVTLDGEVVRGWEGMNALVRDGAGPAADDDDGDSGESGDDDHERRRRRLLLRRTTGAFEYVKYHKPEGVTCTTDGRVRDNVIDAARRDGYAPRHRVYPVGRLDRTTSGLILLTSNGRVVDLVLRGENKMPKVYDVAVDGTLRDDDLRRLRVSGGFWSWFPSRDPSPPPPFLFSFFVRVRALPPPKGCGRESSGVGSLPLSGQRASSTKRGGCGCVNVLDFI